MKNKQEAMVMLKNGNQKFGTLIDFNTNDTFVKFLSNSKKVQKELVNEVIEILSITDILAIDIDLK